MTKQTSHTETAPIQYMVLRTRYRSNKCWLGWFDRALPPRRPNTVNLQFSTHVTSLLETLDAGRLTVDGRQCR